MKKVVVNCVCLCLLVCLSWTASFAEEAPGRHGAPVRLSIGEVGLFALDQAFEGSVTATFMGRPVYFNRKDGRLVALIPVDLFVSPGTYPLSIRYEGVGRAAGQETIEVQVGAREFPVERLTLPQGMVTFSVEVLQRIETEKQRMEAVLETTGNTPLWVEGFIKPVEGEIGGVFGSRRVLNGEERSPHLGVDIKAREGRPVHAAARGRVALVGNFYLTGNTVMVDHGQGVFTIYCHLSRVSTKEGDILGRGEVMGEIGSTGRSTGPHLHWGLRVCGARVDPLSLIEAMAR